MRAVTIGSNPGHPAEFFIFAGSSMDGHPHGGHLHPTPPMVSRRLQVLTTNHPSTDRWVSITTVWRPQQSPSLLFRVGVVDGHNHPTQPTHDYPTVRRARNAANKLYTQLTQETN